MKKIVLALLLGVLIVAWSGCHKPFGIVGNSEPGEETRAMVSFNEVISEASFNVYISHDTIYQVVVEAETNLIPHILTRVNGDKLIIDTKESLTTHLPVNIYIKTPYVKYVELSGSGLVSLDSLESDNLRLELDGSGDIRGQVNCNDLYTDIDGSGNIALEATCFSIESRISGSGDISLLGKADKGEFKISGSGNINAFDFELKECKANISGSGDIYTNVSSMLDASISGSGSIYYIGNPQVIINISGSGSVIKH